jgi:hypothetical protein
MLNKRDKLALFVGAGVSFGCGLPTWSELIKALTERAFPKATPAVWQALSQLDPIPRTRLLRSTLEGRYKRALADSLYANPYQLSEAIQRIARAGIRRICTFNFDDLLEEALASEGIEFNSLVEGDSLNNNYYGTILFHPHGFITQSMDREELVQASIMFSEEDYHSLYSNPYSWANLIQLSLLINYTCLFVGVSFTDPNLRRLLDVCLSLKVTHHHYAIMRSPAFALPTADKPLGKQIKVATEGDLRSLCVEPIWVRRYEEVSDIFKAIRVPRASRRAVPVNKTGSSPV